MPGGNKPGGGLKVTPYKMYGKSPMMKALIGGQKNLAKQGAPELQAAIEASPTKKYNKTSPATKKPKTYKEAFSTRTEKYQDMDEETYIKEAKQQNKKAYGTTTPSSSKATLTTKQKADLKKQQAAQAKTDATGKDKARNKAKAKEIEAGNNNNTGETSVNKDEKKPKSTVNGKEIKSRLVNKNKQGKVNVFSAKYKSMTRSQRAKFYGADYKTRK